SIKGSDDTTIVVRESHHGPFIEGRIPELSTSNSEITMRWEFLKGDNLLLEAFREMNYANSMSAFRKGVSKIHSPGLNAVYADVDNNIAWWACARLIQWNENVNTKAILNGSSGYDDPLGSLPFFLNPNQVNPVNGIVYSANSQSMQPDGELYPGYYVPESRAELIKKELLLETNWNPEDMKKLLLNTMNEVDLTNAFFLEGLLRESKTPFNTLEQMAMTHLRKWDGNYEVESTGASIYQHLHYNLMRAAFLDEISEDQFQQMNRLHWMKRVGIELMRNPHHMIWDISGTEEVETLENALDEAFQLTVEQFRDLYGPNPENWAWGKIHTLEFNHPMAAGG
ncbi:MAG: penicillin acylase family protein, partial [Flavobacteriales bacterium]